MRPNRRSGMVGTETSYRLQKPHSCVDMSFLPPVATEKVPSVVRCRCSPEGNDVAQFSPRRMGLSLSTSLCCSTLTLRQHTRHTFGGITSAPVSVTWSRAFPGKTKCWSQRSSAVLATHTPSPPYPRPGRQNVLQGGTGNV